MAEKYIKHSAGVLTEQEATDTSAGAGDAGKIPALDSTGRLDSSLLPSGIGADTESLTASEALAAGDLVNIWDDGGTPSVRKADATTSGKRAHGFVLAAVSAAASATVYFEGRDDQVSGLTVGTQYLSTTPGLSVDVASVPSASGNVVQVVGVATSATSLNAEFGQPVVLA